MDTLIEANHVSLRFSAPTEKKGSLKKWVLDALRGRVGHKWFLAVDDVSFSIKRGEAVGLVGRNGAGKSTLLKLVTGIVNPTSGSIAVRGQVAPLLALGNGLDPALTGRENIYLNGAILGYEKAWLSAHEDSIIDFSELGEFIDAPVRTYSSGMTMRLAFSIATAASPEILILDEVLAVGDAAFQAKCRARIFEIIDDGATVFFVSHSLSDIVQICTRAIWLDHGKVVMDGSAPAVADAYRRDVIPGMEADIAAPMETGPVPAWLFRSPTYGEEFLTSDTEELAALALNRGNWTPVGVAYRAFPTPEEGAVPLKRFYSKKLRSHLFALDARELDKFRKDGVEWVFEGVAHYVYPTKVGDAIPVYRHFDVVSGKFSFSTSGTGGKLDGASCPPDWEIAWWALPTGQVDGKASNGQS